MTIANFPKLEIPHTIAAGPGPGNTDERVLSAFSGAGVADHMQPDVLRGMVESKQMLRDVWGTENLHTFGVAGTGWSALDMMMSFGAPAGHGHGYYAADYISPWVEVTNPDTWTRADTERLKAHCDNGLHGGCSNDRK